MRYVLPTTKRSSDNSGPARPYMRHPCIKLLHETLLHKKRPCANKPYMRPPYIKRSYTQRSYMQSHASMTEWRIRAASAPQACAGRPRVVGPTARMRSSCSARTRFSSTPHLWAERAGAGMDTRFQWCLLCSQCVLVVWYGVMVVFCVFKLHGVLGTPALCARNSLATK